MSIRKAVTCGILLTVLAHFIPSTGLSQYYSVVTRPPDSVTTTSALLRAIVYPRGASVDVGFQLGQTNQYELGSFFGAHIADTVVSAVVTLRSPSLIPYTRYQYRAWASSSGYPTKFGQPWYFVSRPDSANGGVVVELDYIDHGGIRMAIPSRFGAHPLGSYCLDAALGEYWLPPAPPLGSLELRMTDPRGYNASCMDQGLQFDFRQYRDSAQVDSYKVVFQTSPGGFPVEISWTPLADKYAGDVKMTDFFGGTFVNVDMKAQNSVTIASPLYELLIRAEKPRLVQSLRADSLAGNIARMKALFNPCGVSSWGWFEWGLSPQYGDTSSGLFLGDGFDAVEFTDIIAGMQPQTTYYCRAVTQNSYGIYRSTGISFTTLGSAEVLTETYVPLKTELHDNFPNPFNPSTTISFSIGRSTHATLKIYNALGEDIAILVSEDLQPGTYSKQWNAAGMASGVYFYRLQAGEFVQTRKLILMK